MQICEFDASSEVLKIVLAGDAKIVGSSLNYIFSSPNVVEEAQQTFFWRFIQPNAFLYEYSLASRFAPLQPNVVQEGVVGFSAHGNGRVLPVEVTAGKGLVVFRDVFLCATEQTKVEPSHLQAGEHLTLALYLGPTSSHCVYTCTSLSATPAVNQGAPSLVFIQSSGTILEKQIVPGEGLFVSLNAIVAYEETITMQLASSLFHDTIKVQCIGSGKVYLSSFGSRKPHKHFGPAFEQRQTMGNAPYLPWAISFCISLIVVLLLFKYVALDFAFINAADL